MEKIVFTFVTISCCCNTDRKAYWFWQLVQAVALLLVHLAQPVEQAEQVVAVLSAAEN